MRDAPIIELTKLKDGADEEILEAAHRVHSAILTLDGTRVAAIISRLEALKENGAAREPGGVLSVTGLRFGVETATLYAEVNLRDPFGGGGITLSINKLFKHRGGKWTRWTGRPNGEDVTIIDLTSLLPLNG